MPARPKSSGFKLRPTHQVRIWAIWLEIRRQNLNPARQRRIGLFDLRASEALLPATGDAAGTELSKLLSDQFGDLIGIESCALAKVISDHK